MKYSRNKHILPLHASPSTIYIYIYIDIMKYDIYEIIFNQMKPLLSELSKALVFRPLDLAARWECL